MSYVKLYLRFVDAGPNSFEESFAERAETIWANLQEAFSGQNIYFVPGFSGCTGAESYQVINSSIFPDLGNLTAFNALMGGSTSGVDHFIPDGINLYIFRDNIIPTGEAGHSFCLPSNYCFVGGKSNCCPEPLSTTNTVAHEIGHCLGLVHTNFNVGCPADETTDGNTTGDMVSDTPYDSADYGATGDCVAGVLPENIMSEFPIATCRNKFTDGQGARMRHYLQNELGVLETVKMHDLVITGNQVWSTPTHVPANVIIEPGAILTIQAPVFMQENAFIYVKANFTGAGNTAGGQLRVDELVTAACPNKFWKGIFVEGNEAFLQSSNKQGKVIVLNDGIIEHARVGVMVEGLDLTTGLPRPISTGGIVLSSLGTFRNNLVDVHFEDYSNPNQSFFNFTDFITDNNFRGGLNTPPLHLLLNGVNNIKISNSDFEDLRSASFISPQTRARGVDAINANFFVSGTTDFTNLFEGVRLTGINPVHGVSILGATFTKCFNGIHSTKNYNFQFSGNTFLMERPSNYTEPASTPFNGMYMEGETAAFTVSGNTFQSTDFSSTDNYTGTDVLALTKQNNTIFNNDFLSLNTANRANGLNAGGNEFLFSGLTYECNEYLYNTEFDHLIQSGRIRKEQGARNPSNNKRIPTGNKFNEGNFPIAEQFENLGIVIDYHQDDEDDQILFPDKYFGVNPETTNEQYNCNSETTEPCPTYPCNPIIVAGLKSQFFQQKQQWNAKMTVFPTLTNSTQIHSEAISINTLRRNLDQLGNKIILHHALDTVGAGKDSVLVWLGHLDTYDADMQLAQHHFFSGNFTTANNLLNSLPSQYNLSGDVLEAHNQTNSVLSTVYPALSQNIAVNALPTPVLDTLEIHWGTHCSGAGALARSLLYQNGRRLYAVCNATEERDTPSGKIPKSAWEEQGNQISISPNPANQTLQLSRTIGDKNAQLRIVGLTGTVHEYLIPEGQITTVFSTIQLPTGLYTVVLVEEGKVVARRKLIIFH